MNFYGFSINNGFRNKIRTGLMILGIMVSIFLLNVLQIFLRELSQPPSNEESSYRLVVIPKTSIADILPIRYYDRIKKIEGIYAVTPLIWFGGIYIDERNFFPNFAVDPSSIFNVLSESEVAVEELEAFKKERTACIVGVKTMERFNWKVGQKITLQGTIWGFNAELIIRGTYKGTVDDTNLFFRYDYFDDMMNKLGLTGSFWIKAKSSDDVPKIAKEIDETFKNTEAETKTETERAFVLGFISMLGDIKVIIGSLASVIMFTLMIVTAGTMAMNIRERYREIAMLKAIGFNRFYIIRLVLTEIICITMIGAALGCLFVYVLLHSVDITKLSQGTIVSFEYTKTMMGRSMLAAFIVGLISSLTPTLSVLRISVVDGLRDVE